MNHHKLIPTNCLFPAAALAGLLAFGYAGAQEEDCSRPWPVQMPAETPTDKDQMLDLQRSVKGYLEEANEYLACNEEVVAELREAAGALVDAVELEEAELQIQNWITRYNNTVDEMHAVGERFNALVRQYKEENPG